MQSIVLIKEVPDIRVGKVVFTEKGTLDRSKMGRMLNPDDAHAMEAALRLREKHGGKITTLSMGPPTAEDSLRFTIEMGADEAVLESDIALGGSDTLATAYALTEAIKKLGEFDFIFAGLKALDGETGQVGPQVAENLHIPEVAYVEEILNIDTENKLIESRAIFEGGYTILVSKYPALLTITPTFYEPRRPTPMNILKAKKAVIRKLTAKDCGLDLARIGLNGSPTKVAKSGPGDATGRHCKFLGEGATLEEILQVITSNSVQK
jgi:electron transfer flavoprotein alpha/beta subunit